MWERSSLKERAKQVFKANYWKCVLAALVLMIALGGGGGSSAGGSSSSNISDDIKEVTDSVSGTASGAAISQDDVDEAKDAIGSLSEAIIKAEENLRMDENAAAIVGTIVVVVFVIVLIAIAIGVAITTFLLNPLQLGGRKFFLKNLNEKASLKELGAGFEKGYMNVVKTMFLVDLSCFLWSLLFIIPGIIKRYEYRMVVYLLAQNPEMDAREAKEKSSQMMSGQKWAAFVLDLSFIGWHILSVFTCGILSIFYVNPYMYQTEAALFEALNGGTGFEMMQQIEASNYDTYVEM